MTTESTTPPSTPAEDAEGKPRVKTFADFGLDPALVEGLAEQGIIEPFPIQSTTLPMALRGADIIGQARTGTGKTFGFGLPLLHRIDTDVARTQALIITPTRELAIQVANDLSVGERRGVTITTIYGGVGYEPQIEALQAGVHVVVGTPGRLLDLLNRRDLDLSEVRALVLDEADEMLDLGFLPDVERLIAACPEDRHTMLFSATMPAVIVSMARKYMDKPTFMRAEMDLPDVAPTVDQYFFEVHPMDKPRVLARILQQPGRGGVYVFCRTKRMCDRLVDDLENLGVRAITIHGDLTQAKREVNLDKFRDAKVNVLVATEVAARGLDVEDVTHVVNYDIPDDEKMYLHRIGRTARAGAKGVAVTFAAHDEVTRLQVIRKAVEAEDHQVHQVFSTSPLLRELFDLPEETPWAHLSGGRGKRSSGRDRDGERRSRSERTSDGRRNASRSVPATRSTGSDEGSRGGTATATDTKARDGRDGAREERRPRGRDGASTRRDRDGRATGGSDDPDRQVESTGGRATGNKADTNKASANKADTKKGRAKPEGGATERDAARPHDADEPTGDAASNGAREGGRQRRGRRGRDTSTTTSRTVTTDSGARVRIRVRDTEAQGGDASSTGDDGGPPAARQDDDRRSRDDRPEGRARATRDTDDGGDDDGRSQRRRGRGGSGRGGSGRSSSSRSISGRSSSNRAGSGSNGRGGQQGSSRRGSADDRGRRQPATAEAATRRERVTRRGDDARGDGEPGFRRRVEVEHLP